MNLTFFARSCFAILIAKSILFSAQPADLIPNASLPPGGSTSRRGLSTHDPSTIVKGAGEYWLFSTGNGIVSRRSRDLITWEEGPRVFSNSPAWTTNAVPGFRSHFWAPDIIQLKDQFLLYYSVSRWGVNTSAIGLATNPTLDPSDPKYRWIDQGLVFQSGKGDNFNAIDPAVTKDAEGGLWLSFGSFWSGIKLIQLDPATGKRIATNSPIYSLAYQRAIEAPCITRHGEYYYLFINWGQCCRGTNSTYNIRIGRGQKITGPYLDKAGMDMAREGGTIFLETSGPVIGPGHAGIFSEGGTNWFSYHFYDGNNRGSATLAVRRLQWNANGWPTLVETTSK